LQCSRREARAVRARAAVAGLVAALACSPALRKPAPLAPAAPSEDRSAPALLADAEAAFARRPDPAAVRTAVALYRAAAQADPAGVEGLHGALRAAVWLAQRERSAEERARRATEAVELGQLCDARAPEDARCDYDLALGLGVQARERPSTVAEGLKLMVERLRRAAARDPAIDHGGPERCSRSSCSARRAGRSGPAIRVGARGGEEGVHPRAGLPPNPLALAEALAANGDPAGARAAAQRGLALAEARAAAGIPTRRSGYRRRAGCSPRRRRRQCRLPERASASRTRGTRARSRAA
jgi:hypothetical protein